MTQAKCPPCFIVSITVILNTFRACLGLSKYVTSASKNMLDSTCAETRVCLHTQLPVVVT